MPEKNNSTLGKRFLEILFGVLLATRFCLSHAWPRPHRLLCSPHCQQKGKGERLGASSPCQEKPWWPSRRVGRNPGWPRFPHPLPTPALGPQQVFCPRKERAHENTHSCSELTTPTAGPARAWPQGCCGDSSRELHCLLGTATPGPRIVPPRSAAGSPGTAPPCRARGGTCQHCRPCLQQTGSPLLPLGAPISTAQTLPARDALRCVSVTPRAEPTLQEHVGAEIPAALEHPPPPEGVKTLQHHSQASFLGVERRGRTRGSCYKYKICYKEKTYIVHL